MLENEDDNIERDKKFEKWLRNRNTVEFLVGSGECL